MKNLSKILLLSCSVMFATSCRKDISTNFASVKEMTDEAKKSVNFITAEDFKSQLISGEKYYLIDCREPIEFDSACIKGAINIPRGVLEFEISERAPNHRLPLIIYCSNGDRSTLVAKLLPMLKYSSIKVIDKGFNNWKITIPELVEQHPVRGENKAKTPVKSSGGCGG